MTTSNKTVTVAELVFSAIGRIPNIRTQAIIERRFGLKDKSPETLEAIGADFLITRERVRQIENEALKKISKEGRKNGSLFPLFKKIDQLLTEYQGIIGEEKIFKEFSKKKLNEIDRRAIVFVLTAGRYFLSLKKTKQFKKAWYAKGTNLQLFFDLTDYITDELNKIEKPVSPKKLLLIVKEDKRFKKLPDHVILGWMEIPTEIAQSILGKWGLSHWPEIKPKGVRDKIYLVFKKTDGPMHFSLAAEKVNSAAFGSKRVCLATVHNELIKDERFVLIGRGIYALKEWHYDSGTVADVLVKVMKENKGPFKKEFLVTEVLKQRRVKPETIVLNLQKTNLFIKEKEGAYCLAKK